jgi:hypothetical protein
MLNIKPYSFQSFINTVTGDLIALVTRLQEKLRFRRQLRELKKKINGESLHTVH